MERERVAAEGQTAELDKGSAEWPEWMPAATRTYLAHTERGQTLRALAKEANVHPSTILRRVRRVEGLREDPLLDSALRRVAEPEDRAAAAAGTDEEVERNALPVLRRMAEADAVLAVARDLEKAVVARSGPDGEPQRLAVVEQSLVVDMAIRDWIACSTPEARIQRYHITSRGRALVKRLSGAQSRPGLAEGPAPFAGAEPVDRLADEARRRQFRAAQTESPLAPLARRKDGQGQPFLSREQVAIGDRLREDFLVAQGEGTGEEHWEEMLAAMAAPDPAERASLGADTAKARVERAVIALGPGLADVVLRTCCLLEGLEQVERRLGWSARSGKVVLPIGLDRLSQHYRGVERREGLLIG